MDEVEVSTVVYVPPTEIYEFLVDFPGYADYSKYLTEVRQHGEGGPGTRYDLRFSWWKLTYTVRSEVEALDPPERIDWTVVRGVDASGAWLVEPAPDAAPDGRDAASRVRLSFSYAPESAKGDALGLPAFVSFDWVVDRVKPLALEEAERVVERIVADLEGERRPVDLTVHERSDAG